MKVEFEQIPGKPSNLRPMPLTELVRRGLGSKVYVWWAEYDNPLKVRMNGVYTMTHARSFGDTGGAPLGAIRVPCSVTMSPGPLCLHVLDAESDQNRMSVGMHRGMAHLYYPPEED